jgi:hypothetical protein
MEDHKGNPLFARMTPAIIESLITGHEDKYLKYCYWAWWSLRSALAQYSGLQIGDPAPVAAHRFQWSG